MHHNKLFQCYLVDFSRQASSPLGMIINVLFILQLTFLIHYSCQMGVFQAFQVFYILCWVYSGIGKLSTTFISSSAWLLCFAGTFSNDLQQTSFLELVCLNVIYLCIIGQYRITFMKFIIFSEFIF